MSYTSTYTGAQIDAGIAKANTSVQNSGNETIAGTKTFSSTISGNVSGTSGGLTGVPNIAVGALKAGSGATLAPGTTATIYGGTNALPSGAFKGTFFVSNYVTNDLGICFGGLLDAPYGQYIQAYDGRNSGASTFPLLLQPNGGGVNVGGLADPGSGNLIISGATATKASGTTWANPSDQRIKGNVKEYNKGIDELAQINVCEWEYNGKGGSTAGMKGIGVIADEAEKILPETVTTYKAKLNADDEQETDIKQFDASEVIWLLVKSVQQLSAKVAALEASK